MVKLRQVMALLVGLVLVLGSVGVATSTFFGARPGGGPVDGPGAGDLGSVPTSTPDAGTANAPEPGLARFYGQALSWESCRRDALCAVLEVPLDYARPRGETIELAVLKVPASDPDRRVGSLVVNPGGPGAPGTDYAASARAAFRSPVLDAYDIVGFDPRGTGASAPVDCLTDDELDAYLAQDPDPDTPREVAAYTRWNDAVPAGCARRSGLLAAHVSTIEAARDMDVLRAVLGEPRLAFFGASYGTELGATYAELFPDRVGRFVLDGAVDVSLSNRDLGLQQAAGFEAALRSYVQDCVDGDDCVLGTSVEDGLERIRRLLDDVDAEPLPTDGDRLLEVGNAFYGVVAPLYRRENWDYLTAALKAAFGGDGTALLQLSDFYTGRDGSGYADNQIEASHAISCLDDPSAIRADEVPDTIPDFEQVAPTFGAVFAWGQTGCSGMQVESTEPPLEIDGSGAAPIVVVGTTRDPATPYDWAVSLADQLESGVLVSRDGDGHTGYNSGNDCVDSAVEDYLIEGTVPDDGLSC